VGKSSGFLTGMRQRLERLVRPPSKNGVSVFSLFNQTVAFLDGQSVLSFTQNVALLPADLSQQVLNRTLCVFVIPTKIRAYSWALPKQIQDLISWPSPAYLEVLEKYQGTSARIIDLSPVLISEAQRLSQKGEFIFWRDDTHWNGNGMAAVVPQILECLQKARPSP
jgi:hypothetical protein